MDAPVYMYVNACCLIVCQPGSLVGCLCAFLRFIGCDKSNRDKFFTPAQRSMIAWDILERVRYGDKEEQFGEW